MIILTRFGGHPLAVNPDLIERAEATPDTVITLVDGHKLVVTESVREVIARVRHWRASVAASAFLLSSDGVLADGTGTEDADEPVAPPRIPEQTGGTAGREALEQMADLCTVDASLARVLRMPQRGE